MGNELEYKDDVEDSNADELDDLKLEFLDRSAPVSNARKSVSIEELREKVAQSSRTILVGDFNGKKRIAIQRNTIRLVTFEIVNEKGLTDDQIRHWVRTKLLNGDFDYEITTLYNELYGKLKH
jgi:hypothetical protein